MLILLLPNFVFASVQVTEIMYDMPGVDTGREWIEVTNTGPEAIDISKYKFFESGTNHGLVFVSGSKILPAGGSSIIASDAKKFSIDNPAFSGTLFDSSFALSNTGESLVIKNASSTELDTASYVANEGANGEGGSLHKSGNIFIVGLPTAGVYPGEIIAVPKAPAKEKAAVKKTTTTTKKSAASGTKKSSATSSANQMQQQEQSASAAQAPAVPTLFLWIMALAAVLLLGIAGVIFLLVGGKETFITADEFKIQ